MREIAAISTHAVSFCDLSVLGSDFTANMTSKLCKQSRAIELPKHTLKIFFQALHPSASTLPLYICDGPSVNTLIYPFKEL